MAEDTKVEVEVPVYNDSFGTENLYEWYAAPVRIKVSKEEYVPGDINEMVGTPLPPEKEEEEDKGSDSGETNEAE